MEFVKTELETVKKVEDLKNKIDVITCDKNENFFSNLVQEELKNQTKGLSERLKTFLDSKEENNLKQTEKYDKEIKNDNLDNINEDINIEINKNSRTLEEMLDSFFSDKEELSEANKDLHENSNEILEYIDNNREEKNDEIGNSTEEKDNKDGDVEKKGGRYGDVFKNGEGEEYEVHHMPANNVNGLELNDGPAIKMDKEDHRETASCGNSKEAREYRAKQKELIEEGKFREALQMDIDDIHEKFEDKYDDAISEMLEYVDKIEGEGKI